MNWFSHLFGWVQVPPNANSDSPQDSEAPPSKVDIEGAPSFIIEEHSERHEGYLFMAWEHVRNWLSRVESPEHQSAAWREAKRAWLLHMRCALGPSFRLRESKNVLLLSSLEPKVAGATLDYMERTLQRVASLLDGVARMPVAGKK